MAEKLQVLRRLLWLCFFSVFTVVVGNTVLLAVPQARETLYALDDGSGQDLRRFVFFALAYLYWAVTAWFVARMMLARRFDPDTVGAGPALMRYANACARIIPRALGLLACVPLALAMLGVSKVYAAVLLTLAAGFVLFVWRRRELFPPDALRAQEEFPYYRVKELPPPRAWVGLGALFALSWAVFVALWLAPVQVGRFIGSPALLLVALGAWTLVGSMALSYWPKTRRWPSLTALPLLLLVAGSAVDNHPVARPRDTTPATDWRAQRPTLEAHFDAWMARHPPQDPVYLVAVAGGASRAAYWAGMTLARLEDEARRNGGRPFGRNLFMLSGVSGGSLGAAAFVTALAAWPGGEQPMSRRLDDLLGQDLLAPAVGMLLYPDLLQRFIPVVDRLRIADRSYALEHAWALDWQDQIQRFGSYAPRAATWWDAPLVQPYLDRPGLALPALVLNTVRLEDGQRLLQSNLAFELPEVPDLLAHGFDTHHLTLAGAVHNSARFPYISPPGRVQLVAPAPDVKPPPWGHLGDGGYHEASGTRTLLDVMDRLQASQRLRAGASGLQACRVAPAEAPAVAPAEPPAAALAGEPAASAPAAMAPSAHCDSPVVLVILDNQPSAYGPAWQRSLDGPVRAPDAQALTKAWPVPELSAPPQGLIAAWGSNSTRAEWHFAHRAGPTVDRYIELRFPLYALKRQPSMNWQLDADSRQVLREASAPASPASAPLNLSDQALRVNLQRLRGWIARSTP